MRLADTLYTIDSWFNFTRNIRLSHVCGWNNYVARSKLLWLCLVERHLHKKKYVSNVKCLPYLLAAEFAQFLSLWSVLGRWMVREQRQLALNIKHLWQLSLNDSSYCRTIFDLLCGCLFSCVCVLFRLTMSLDFSVAVYQLSIQVT